MASEQTDDSGSTGCAKKGVGCAGVLFAIAIGSIIIDFAFFYYPFASWGVTISGALVLAGGVAGLFVGASVSDPVTHRQLGTASSIVLGFGVLCLVTTIGMSLRPSPFSYEEQVSPMGSTVGPIEIPKATRIGVRVRQAINEGRGSVYQRWSFVTVELLDENKEYLSSFGGEFWHYAGYDDGHWEQSDHVYSTTLRIPAGGTYYARLDTEANVPEAELGPVTIEMQERAWWGYPVPLRWAAYVSLFFGAILFVAPRVGRSSRVVQQLEEGGEVQFDGQVWTVQNEVHFEYDDCLATEWILHPTGVDAKTPRYLEREYETDGNWERWFISRPIDVEDLREGDSEATSKTVQRYVTSENSFPDRLIYDDTRYSLQGSGTAYRTGADVPYHQYESKSGGFITVEGETDETLEAVVGRKISLSELSFSQDQ